MCIRSACYGTSNSDKNLRCNHYKHIDTNTYKHFNNCSLPSHPQHSALTLLYYYSTLPYYHCTTKYHYTTRRAPLRAVVPGHVGVRNVKWVSGVVLSAEEAPGPWQRGMAYKVLFDVCAV